MYLTSGWPTLSPLCAPHGLPDTLASLVYHTIRPHSLVRHTLRTHNNQWFVCLSVCGLTRSETGDKNGAAKHGKLGL